MRDSGKIGEESVVAPRVMRLPVRPTCDVLVLLTCMCCLAFDPVALGRDQPGGEKVVRGTGSPEGRRASGLGTAKAADVPKRPGGADGGDNLSEAEGLVTLETVLADPKRIAGDELLLDGVYKTGTRVAEVKQPDGTSVGWALPIARNDDRTICTPDGKVKGYKTLLLIDEELAPALGRVFAKLRFKATINPSYKCLITAVTRTLEANGEKVTAVVIVALEMLGETDYQKVAMRQFDRAFRTVKIRAREASVGYGDGNAWVERLGGEQKFVLPLRAKFRELQVRMVNERNRAAVDAYMQRELGAVIRTAAVAQEQYVRSMNALMGQNFRP